MPPVRATPMAGMPAGVGLAGAIPPPGTRPDLQARSLEEETVINYNTTLYDSLKLKDAADAFLRQLPLRTDLLLSRGSSGASIAAAMLARYVGGGGELAHCYVRKPHDDAHSSRWAGTRNLSRYAVIVDDLIDTGSTIEAILEYSTRRIHVTHILVGKVWEESAAQAFANRWQKTIIEVDRDRVTKPLKIEHINEEEEDNDETMQHGD